jgi:hypothetical protein
MPLSLLILVKMPNISKEETNLGHTTLELLIYKTCTVLLNTLSTIEKCFRFYLLVHQYSVLLKGRTIINNIIIIIIVLL